MTRVFLGFWDKYGIPPRGQDKGKTIMKVIKFYGFLLLNLLTKIKKMKNVFKFAKSYCFPLPSNKIKLIIKKKKNPGSWCCPRLTPHWATLAFYTLHLAQVASLPAIPAACFFNIYMFFFFFFFLWSNPTHQPCLTHHLSKLLFYFIF